MPGVRKVAGRKRQGRDPMAQRGRPSDSVEPKAQEDPLKEYGLTLGEQVRFRTTDSGDWTYGNANTVEKDGSIRLYVKTKARSILPTHCQVKRVGPRGGITWEPLEKVSSK
jgi:hypothetical protein